MISPEEFGKLFETFDREAFRLETLDYYDAAGTRTGLPAFLAGEDEPEQFKNSPWVTTVRNAVQAGKRMYRVHVVATPLTDYLRFEFAWGYHRNAAAGEEFFILDLAEHDVPGLPDHDFWLFDERKTVRMGYDSQGAYTGADVLPESQTSEYIRYRDIALKHAEPLASFWERHS
ncbi:DUF6879 family protein [Nonomuraea sp. NEAU-A123]|uniref:DUF6879 family protein n=1 Tax=Nonomuraea sp. NEAU-A123 TaxID=2839649 RepID=UPI001BE499BA|nr:DUF6879 family protein [Nonomuraea sp. NEAU-A123]MBT2229178.1 hypothetical protein [Nonomuraea sp. NEAU-A123]